MRAFSDKCRADTATLNRPQAVAVKRPSRFEFKNSLGLLMIGGGAVRWSESADSGLTSAEKLSK